MKIRTALPAFLCTVFLFACRVTFITGYDQILDETIHEMKKDFNLHYLKLKRTIQDSDPNNQNIANFQDYYDNMEVDLMTITDRTKTLDGKAAIVKQQVANLNDVMHKFMEVHKMRTQDRPDDDMTPEKNAVNSAMDAVTILQESLKSTGKE